MENSLIDVSNEVVDLTNELKETALGLIPMGGLLESMDPNTLKLMQVSLQLVEASNRLIHEQAKTLSDMDHKLDYLMEKKNSKKEKEA